MSPPRTNLSRNQKLTLTIAIIAIAVTIGTSFFSGHDWFTLPRKMQIAESRGRVISEVSQRPISNAKVTLDLDASPFIVYTDSEGFYILKVAIEGKMSGQIRVDASGYQPYSRFVTIIPELGVVEDIRLSQLPNTTQVVPIETLPIVASPTIIASPTLTQGKIYATISTEIFKVIMRKSPGYINKSDATDVIVEIDSGQRVEILGDKQETDGLLWWKVYWNGYTGWVVERTGSGKVVLVFDQ